VLSETACLARKDRHPRFDIQLLVRTAVLRLSEKLNMLRSI
jgi:hypothetical protein